MSYQEFFSNQTEANPQQGRTQKKGLSCASCGLSSKVNTPCMKPHGKGNKRVVWIGEAPGEDEDKLGIQWQGKVGKYLQKVLKTNYDFTLFEDAICINAVNCRPQDNRKPSPNEIECCRQKILSVIQQNKPNLIVLAGGSAVESVIGYRWNKDLDGITKWRGFHIPDHELGAWVCPVFHPSYVLRSQDLPQVEKIFLDDLKETLAFVDRPLPEQKKSPVQILRSADEIARFLNKLKEHTPEMIAFDYETTGLKPHKEGHKIVCMAIARENMARAFMMPPDKSPAMREIKRLLINPNIVKIAHNLQFEDTWSKVILGVQVMAWKWDSMIAAHVLDNRQKITGLKFQACINFGVYDYSSEIDPYLKGKDPKDANSINRIQEFIDKVPNGEEKVLTYCGMDAWLEYRLAKIQMDRLDAEEYLRKTRSF